MLNAAAVHHWYNKILQVREPMAGSVEHPVLTVIVMSHLTYLSHKVALYTAHTLWLCLPTRLSLGLTTLVASSSFSRARQYFKATAVGP